MIKINYQYKHKTMLNSHRTCVYSCAMIEAVLVTFFFMGIDLLGLESLFDLDSYHCLILLLPSVFLSRQLLIKLDVHLMT